MWVVDTFASSASSRHCRGLALDRVNFILYAWAPWRAGVFNPACVKKNHESRLNTIEQRPSVLASYQRPV